MAEMMKALIVDKDGFLSVREVPKPRPAAVQALVRTEACGMCNGTDGKLISRTFKNMGPDKYPLILGHEAVGIVEEVGSAVTRYKVGDRVMLPCVGPTGGYETGWGGFAEYGVVDDIVALVAEGVCPGMPGFPENSYIQDVVDQSISAQDAVVMVTLREVLASIRYFGVRFDQSVAVFGCGPVGQTFIKFMHLLGAGPIFAMDVVDEKLEAARACGADYVFNSRDEGFISEIRRACPQGVDYAIDAAGAAAIIDMSMKIIADRGKICCYGISEKTSMRLDWSHADYNWQLIFQQMPRKEEEHEAHSQILVWMEQGVVRPSDFISDVYSFENVLDAFGKLKKREIAKKCIITFP